MRWGIVGVSLVNRGGEAMVFEACRKVSELDRDAKIYLLTHNPRYDLKYLNKHGNTFNIKVLDIVDKGSKFRRLASILHDFVLALIIGLLANDRRYALRYFNSFKTRLAKYLSYVDIVLEIPGIAYCDAFGLRSAFYSTFRKIVANLMKKPYYCLPHAVGPANNLLIKLLAKIGLSRVSYVMVRGPRSLLFLKSLNLSKTKIALVPDLAFSFSNPSTEECNRVYQQLNLSLKDKYVMVVPNAHLYRWRGLTIVRLLAQTIDYIVEQYGYRVLMLPHEISGDKPLVDDMYMCKAILKKCKHKDRVMIIEKELTTKEIRALMRLCDFSIVMRFHAMISSLCMGVPPLVIGWADKYMEIMRMFDLHELVLDYRHLSLDMLKERIDYIVKNLDEFKNTIAKRTSYFTHASDIMKTILCRDLHEKHIISC